MGGFFFRARDPRGLAEWYERNLGLNVYAAVEEPWMQEAGPTVFSPFEHDTDYFGSPDQQSMVNFRVRDLDAMLSQLQQTEWTSPTTCSKPTTDASAGPPTPRAIASSSGSPRSLRSPARSRRLEG